MKAPATASRCATRPIISAGLGGVEMEILARQTRKGAAVAIAPTGTTDGAGFFEYFRNTLSYDRLSGAMRGSRRLLDDAILVRCFQGFIDLANHFSAVNPEARFHLEELEVNPFSFRHQRLVPLDALAGEDVTRELRAETTGNRASIVAAVPAVREALVARQRAFRRPPGLVADGRDMGTVIFPDAEAKVFLTASARERARRRHKQLLEKGIDANLERLYVEIAERDRRDSERAVPSDPFSSSAPRGLGRRRRPRRCRPSSFRGAAPWCASI